MVYNNNGVFFTVELKYTKTNKEEAEKVHYSDADFDIPYRQDPLTAMEMIHDRIREKERQAIIKEELYKQEKEKQITEEKEKLYQEWRDRQVQEEKPVTPHVYNKYNGGEEHS